MGDVSPLPALARGYVTFGTLTRRIRINHRTIAAWAAILKRVSNSRLVIDSSSFRHEYAQTLLQQQFAAHGIGPERLQLGCHTPPWDTLRGIDIGLDCFPHNSGTTLFETLYMGVPFVTLASRPSVGRIGSAILHAAEHPQWIAETEDDYVQRACALAADLPKLAAVRANLRAEMERSPLMAEAGFARSVEAAYQSMFQRWAAR
jgi:protein O-GlcNAc transferase